MLENQARFIRQVTMTADVLFHGKWKLQILCAMQSGPVRLGQLTRMIPQASKKVLTKSLRELEANGIVLRKDMSDQILHIEYELRPDLRDGVCLLLEQVAKWGQGYLSEKTGHERRGEGPGGGT